MAMEIIPAIDILGGRCVRLEQGDYARETVFCEDPAKMAERWQALGARRLHVVDLDGAREGRPVNKGRIRELAASANVPVQLGGGVRSIAAIEEYLDSGIDRVVLGTAAIKDEMLLTQALSRFNGRIAVGVDARNGTVVMEGWLEDSGVAAVDFVGRLASLGVPRIIYTDILRDGTLAGPNLDALQDVLAGASRLKDGPSVIASGGVSTLEDLRRLAELGPEGVIIGKALYTGAVKLEEALAL